MSNRVLGILGVTLLAVALAIGSFGTALAQQGGPGGPGWGPGGMMGGNGGWGMGPGMMGGGYGYGATGQALKLEDARRAVENYLSRYGDPTLQVDEVMEFERNFYAIVAEPGAEVKALELLVDKRSGAVFPEYGPNMMWNTEYGHMGGFGGMMGGWFDRDPAGEASVSEEQARALAQEWLDANLPGSTAGHPDALPGYYTLHTERDGRVTGMLSVNAASGQVWFHDWHGDFIAELAEE